MKVAEHRRWGDVWSGPDAPYVGVDHQLARLAGVGPDLLIVIRLGREAMDEFHQPASRQPETTRDKFRRLAGQWKTETAVMSSVTQMALHPAYQEIIGLGRDAVPLLLHELSREPDHWFWALRAISGIDPVPPTDRGNVPKMTEAWVRWGRSQGYTTS